MSGFFTAIPTGTDVNLTTNGLLDWVHWGTFTEFASDRKAVVAPLISEVTPYGGLSTDGPFQYSDNFNGYSWTDGSPHTSISNSPTGLYEFGKNNGTVGLQFNASADTTWRVLKVYVGTFAARGQITATLSDGGGYVNTTINNTANGPGGFYTLIYAADSPDQVLTVKWAAKNLAKSGGNATLQAAALSYYTNNNPPVIWLMSPTNFATIPASTDVTLAATALDVDGSVTNVEFFADATKLGETNAPPFTLVWSKVPLGRFLLTARAADDAAGARVSSPLEILSYSNGGSLAVTFDSSPTNVVLSSDGTHDWAHWGLVNSNSFDHRASVPQQIPNFTRIGPNDVHQLDDDFTQWSWSGGTPTATASDSTTAVYIFGYTNGFTLPLPAGTNWRSVRIYVGVYAARAKFQAALSDLSAPAYTDESFTNKYHNSYRVYSLTYAAASEGQTLDLRLTSSAVYDAIFGNVTLRSASLDAVYPLAILTAPTNNAQFVELANIPLSATATDWDGTVARVEFYEGPNKIGETSTAPYGITWSNVPQGNYSLTARATDNDGAAGSSLPILVRVLTNTPPAVTLTNPPNGATFVEGDNVTLGAQAFDVDGSVKRVEFFADAAKLGERTNAPFTLVWSNPAAGSHTLTAAATDDHGILATSAPVGIMILGNLPPTVAITNPVSGQGFARLTDILISASAGDSDGAVRRVDFFADNALVGQRTNAPFSLTWSSATLGSHFLTAAATDDRGKTNLSEAVQINISNRPPLAALIQPVNGDRFFEDTNVTLVAGVSDLDGSIARVEFFESAHKLGESSNAPFSLTMNNMALGDYQFTVRATDSDGATTVSAPVAITVVTNAPPSVTITNPVEGQTFFATTNITISADAFDSDGWVRLVQFLWGDTKLGEASAAPFSMVWSNVPRGTYSLRAIAYDNWRGSTVSLPVGIRVTNSPPGVDLTAPASGHRFFEGMEIPLSALASDPDGTVARVEFFADTNKLGEVTNAPFSLLWSNAALGDHMLTARATDDNGATTLSAAALIHVVTNAPPIVVITGPTNGGIFLTPLNLTITVQTSDPDGSVTLIEFFADTKRLGAVRSPFSFVWTNVPRGSFLLTAIAHDDWTGTNVSAPVVISVSNRPPEVMLQQPTDGTRCFQGTNLDLTASPADLDGSMARVEFFEGTNLLAELTNAPWTFTWSNVVAGNYALSAQATDNDGAGAVSAAVAIEVVSNLPPNVALTSPSNGDGFLRLVNLTISAEASDSDGFVRLLEFLDGTNLLAVFTNVPCSFIWSNAPLGTHELTVRASDDWDGVSVSTPVTITVSNRPPTVLLRQPATGARFFQGTNLTLQAEATDADGTIALVEFFAAKTVVGQVTNAPFVCTWSNVPAGIYKLTARATDDNGDSNFAEPVVIEVVSNIPPSVAVTDPTNGASFLRLADIVISAAANDIDGTIRQVEFWDGTNLLVVATNAPHSFIWSNAPLGMHELTARASDDWDGVTVSAPVEISVSNRPPGVTLVNPTNGAVFIEGDIVALEATAADLDGRIARVEFFESTNLLAQLTNAPYRFAWSDAVAGDYTLTAAATDDDGARIVSAVVNLTVNTNEPPKISLVAPTNGGSFFSPAVIPIAAAASDPDGTVRLVEFFANDSKLGEATNAPFSLAWSNVVTGSYTLTSAVTDDRGAVTVSADVSIIVNRAPPLIVLLHPLANAQEFTFSFATQPEWNYRVESLESFDAKNWIAVTTLFGDGSTAVITNALSTNGFKLFRVVAE